MIAATTILVLVLILIWYLNKKSKNDFFFQDKRVIREKLDLIINLWINFNFSLYDTQCLSIAFEYFIQNPKEYNGTSVINDFWLIKGLEPESVIHDYDWIKATNLQDYLISNKEYCKRLRKRNANWTWVWGFIFIGLSIVSIFKSIKFINFKTN